MENLGAPFLLMAVAFVVTMLIYPVVLNFAREHKIVDNPNARKLQRVPVPVMGGTTVLVGLLVSFVIAYFLLKDLRVFKVLAILVVMYAVGLWDDIKDIPPSFRFAVEFFTVWIMIVALGWEINDLHGLWGIHEIPPIMSIPLSLIAGVGIINAINLIDGVDGVCCSFGMMACAAFSVVFFRAGDVTMATLALVTIGALIPFFFHNVFGQTSKMFLGDGGSLMLGTLLTLFTFNTLSTDSPCADFGDSGLSLVALSLAILAIPVFDTLKVMIYRVARGKSPFLPDKTHLHHLYIEMGFSHLATSEIIVFVNVTVILVLILCWLLGMSIDWQLYVVIFLGMIDTWGFYFLMEALHDRNDGNGTALYQSWCQKGKSTNISMTPTWQFLRKVVDSRFFGGTPVVMEEEEEPIVVEEERLDPRIK